MVIQKEKKRNREFSFSSLQAANGLVGGLVDIPETLSVVVVVVVHFGTGCERWWDAVGQWPIYLACHSGSSDSGTTVAAVAAAAAAAAASVPKKSTPSADDKEANHIFKKGTPESTGNSSSSAVCPKCQHRPAVEYLFEYLFIAIYGVNTNTNTTAIDSTNRKRERERSLEKLGKTR